MAGPIVILDANILYPAPLRDLLMILADTYLFRARWTHAIQEEWLTNLLEDRPDLSRERLERTQRLMNSHVVDALVTGYEHLIETLELPDPKDRHVLAAAIHSGATIIVTFNLKDFPKSVLGSKGIEAMKPDDFIVRQIAEAPKVVIEVAKEQRSEMTKPSMSVDEYLMTLEKQNLPKTVAFLREHRSEI